MRQLKERMWSQDTLGKIEKDKRLILMGRKKNNDPHVGGINSSFQQGNQEFLQAQEQDKERIFREQDEVIDTLDQGVTNIHAMAIDIGTELDEQNRLLHEFSDDVDTFNGRFGQLQEGMQKAAQDEQQWVPMPDTIFDNLFLRDAHDICVHVMRLCREGMARANVSPCEDTTRYVSVCVCNFTLSICT